MSLREIIAGVTDLQYNHKEPREQPAQQHLQKAYRDLSDLVPIGKKVRVSGSGRSLPIVPWIAVLDPDVTPTAQNGLYVVYLYSADLSRVYLSMNQGVTQHRETAERHLSGVAAKQAAIKELDRESVLIRNALTPAALGGTVLTINLGAPGFLPVAYEAGNICALAYETSHLPNEATLRADLTRFLALYGTCVEIKDQINASDPGLLNTAATKRAIAPIDRKQPIFRPKDSSDYQVTIAGHTQQKTRKHEDLIKKFGAWVKHTDLVVATNCHPRDLTVDQTGTAKHWLIEAKTVKANAEHAVREAIGQLASYRHFYYRRPGLPDPLSVALFTEPVGDAFAELLLSLEIESIWWEAGQWTGIAPDAGTSLLRAVRTQLGL